MLRVDGPAPTPSSQPIRPPSRPTPASYAAAVARPLPPQAAPTGPPSVPSRIAAGIANAAALDLGSQLRLLAKAEVLFAEACSGAAAILADGLNSLARQHGLRARQVSSVSRGWACRLCSFVGASAAKVQDHAQKKHAGVAPTGDGSAAVQLTPCQLRPLPNVGASCCLSAVVTAFASCMMEPPQGMHAALKAAILDPSSATAISVAVAAGIDPLAPQTLAVVLPAVLALVGGRWAGWDISSQWDCTKCNGSQKQPDAASFVLPVSFFGAARAFDVTSCPLVNEARSSMKACCGEAWPLRRTSAARPVAVIGLNASVLGVVPFGPDVVVRAPHACTVAAMISQRDGHVVCWKWWSESWWGVDSDATRAVRGAPPWGDIKAIFLVELQEDGGGEEDEAWSPPTIDDGWAAPPAAGRERRGLCPACQRSLCSLAWPSADS